jgi:hypothetical protein
MVDKFFAIMQPDCSKPYLQQLAARPRFETDESN